MQRRTAAMTATVAGLVLTGSLAAGVAPSYADGTASGTAVSAAKAPTTDGAKSLCHRVPKLDQRLDRAITRLQGGVTTRGSIARLQARVDNATREGHSAIAKFLGDRLSYRKSLLPDLEQRRTDLKSVASWCLTNGDGAGGDTASAS